MSTVIETSPARWASDPWGRYAQRYWDGVRWTDHVASPAGGRGLIDPTPAGPGLAAPVADRDAVTHDHADPTSTAPSNGSGPSDGAPVGNGHRDDAPRWRDDPTGRHAQRYWDGAAWTAFVAPLGGGAPASDPIPAGDEPPSPAPTAEQLAEAPTDAVAMPFAGGAAAGLAPEAATHEALREPAHWGPDPTGRFPQRYWDGTRWTDHVATASGGAPLFDPYALAAGAGVAAIEWHAAGWDDPVVEPEPSALATEAATPNRRWRWIVAASAAALLLLGLGAAVLLSGVLNSSPSKARTSRAPHVLGAGARRPAATATVPGAAVPTTAPAVAIPNLCVLLTPPQVTQATTIPVGPAQPIPNGCTWRGPDPLGTQFAASDRLTLAGQEGVIVFGHPVGANPPSVACDSGIGGIPAESAICTARDGSQYATFVLPSKVVVQISIRTPRAVPIGGLTLLAQLAYTHAG